MAKTRKSSSEIVLSKEILYSVLKHGIKIYPISRFFKWYIEVDNNGKIKTFDKIVTPAELNNSIAKTYQYYYKLLNDKK